MRKNFPSSSPQLTPEQRERSRRSLEEARKRLALFKMKSRLDQIDQSLKEKERQTVVISRKHQEPNISFGQARHSFISPLPKILRTFSLFPALSTSTSQNRTNSKAPEKPVDEQTNLRRSSRLLTFSKKLISSENDATVTSSSDENSSDETQSDWEASSTLTEESSSSESCSALTQTLENFSRKRKRKQIGNKKIHNGRITQNAAQGSDAASDNADDFGPDLQYISIHKINIFHPELRNEMATSSSKDPEEKVIEFIMNAYKKRQATRNKEPVKKGGECSETEKAVEYIEANCEKIPTMKESDKSLFPNEEEFGAKLYFQKIEKRNPIFAAFGAKQVKTVVVHKLIFYYRKNEVFALTTGSAWNVVQWCSDFRFPGKIAARVLNRSGTLSGSKKGLIGTLFKSTKINKEIQEEDPFDLLSYRTEFRTSLEKTSSLLKLQCFRKIVKDKKGVNALQNLGHEESSDEEQQPGPSRPLQPSTAIKVARVPIVHVLQSAIRIEKKLTARDIPAILMHFSLIARGEKTFSLDGKEEEDSSAHRQYLQLVSIEKRKKLDLDLSVALHSAIADEAKTSILAGAEIVHKKMEDYFSAQKFTLMHKSHSSEWDHPPSFYEVIQALRQIPEIATVKRGLSSEDYFTRLSRCRIQYFTDSSSTEAGKPEPLLNCLQIMWTLKADNNVYWKVNANWFHVDPSYVLLVQEEFLQVLKDHIKVNPVELGLHCGKTDLSFYTGKPDFFVPETNEMLDMIKLDENGDLTIFYIFRDRRNSQCMLDGARITNALLHLRKGTMPSTSKKSKAVGGTEHNLQSLETLYEQVRGKALFKLKFKRFSQFKTALQTAEVVVICPAQRGLKSLKKELATPTRVKLADIQKALARDPRTLHLLRHDLKVLSGNEVANMLFRSLKHHDLLTSNGDITSKLLALLSHSLAPIIGEPKRFTDWIYQNLIVPYQPDPASFMGKLQLILVKRKVARFGLKEKFHILEL